MQVVEEGSEQDMSLVEEGDDEKTLEEAEEAKLASDIQMFEVKTEDSREPMDAGKEGITEEIKTEEDEIGIQEQTEEGKDKAGNKATGKPTEEKVDDDALKSPSQIKQKTRERLKEGELFYSLYWILNSVQCNGEHVKPTCMKYS